MESFFIDGIEHITDLGGYDHMLFLLALCAPFTVREWKSVILLATAFTVGHSISLALAAFEVVHFRSSIIEFLIPVTIVITCIGNFFQAKKEVNKVDGYRYAVTAAFGIIHGMGFSSYFRMLSDGSVEMAKNLLCFNLGVEFGQLLIVGMCLVLFTLAGLLKVSHKYITIAATILALIPAIFLLVEKMPS